MVAASRVQAAHQIMQHRLMKTGKSGLVNHAWHSWLLLADGHLNRKLFGDMPGRIWALPVPGSVTSTALTASVRRLPRVGAGEVCC